MRRKMGMLFQFGALFTDMSVYENVAFPLREHADLPPELLNDLVMLKLQAVGLRGAAHLMPAELSGGMARRVALARSIALDPQLILYDEPFTGLDPISFGVIVRLIRDLNTSLGATSIIVTHDVQEALDVVDYVYFMAAGKVIAQGTPDEIRASPEPLRPPVRQRQARWPDALPLPGAGLRRRPRGSSGLIEAGPLRSRLERLGNTVTSQVWRLGYASRFLLLPGDALGHRVPPLSPDHRARSTSPACCR